MERRGWRSPVGRKWQSLAAYAALLAAAFVIGSLAVQFFGDELDNYAYDEMLRRYHPAPWPPKSAILAIDEHTLQTLPGGIQGLRPPLARALRIVSAVRPKTVAVDLTLADHNADPAIDADLADAMRHTPNLVLATDLTDDGWEDPLPAFAAAAVLGEVHAAPDNSDEITRAISLEKAYPPKQRWALSLEAFRLYSGVRQIIESPQSLQVGAEMIPSLAERQLHPGRATNDSRLMRIRFVLPGMPPIPRVSMAKLLADPSLANSLHRQSRIRRRHCHYSSKRPFDNSSRQPVTTGIEINAEAFETMANQLFIIDVDRDWVWLFSLALDRCDRPGVPQPAWLVGLCWRCLLSSPSAVSRPTSSSRTSRVFSLRHAGGG